jgi:hypothetical protein
MTTVQYSLKCLSCGLHYQVYSWNDKWDLEHRPHCPECAEQRSWLIARDAYPDKEIYEFVPGGIKK